MLICPHCGIAFHDEWKTVDILPVRSNVGSFLILLCHKFIRLAARWQHGQRGSVLAMMRAIATRTDVMEFVT